MYRDFKSRNKRIERTVDIMEFMEKLQKQKGEAKALTSKHVTNGQTPEQPKISMAILKKYKILCDRKRDCMRLGIII